MTTITDLGRPRRRRSTILRRVLAGALALALLLMVVAAVLLVPIWRDMNRADGQMVSGGERRTYLLHVPAGYDPATPAPLVISIHGFAEWPAHQAQISRWNDLADEKGFIVVYPSGTGMPKRWRAGGFGQAGDGVSGVSLDTLFIAGLIDTLSARYNIDQTRIYANGLSNGGGMSYVLACQLADRIAAAGGVSGAYLLPLSDCRPERPVPLIVFHGTADTIVPYDGGPSAMFNLPFPSVPGWVAGWAGLSGCATAPEPFIEQGEVTGIRYKGCRSGADVVFYTVEGGGHTWPGGDPLPEWITGRTTTDIDATAVMWEFFSQHPMPAR